MPKILYVVNDAWFLASHRWEIVQAAVEAGFDVHILAKSDSKADAFEALGCTFHVWNVKPRGSGPIAEIKTLCNLYNVVSQLRPDVVHLVTIKALMYGGIVCRLLRTPAVIFAFAGLGKIFSSQTVIARCMRAIVMSAYRLGLSHKNAYVIVQNDSDEAFFLSKNLVSNDRLLKTPGSGVDLTEFSETPEPNTPPVRVLMACRMLLDKGVQEFVDVAQRMGSKHPALEFVLAGQSDPENPNSVDIDTLLAWEQQGVVSWLGHIDNMPSLIAGVHVVVLPTYYGEGLPKVLIESGASGRPVVTTDWPGCREIVTDGDNGYLVPVKDDRALETAISALVSDPKLRAQFGRRGRENAEANYSVESVVVMTLELYRQAISRSHPN